MTPTELTFNTRAGDIGALQWGTGHSKLILALHGWLDNAASFAQLAPLLAKQGYQVIAIDFPGHGLSHHRAIGHNYAFIDYLLDLQAVMDQLTQPLILLAHSMGAAMASMFTAAYPKSVEQLILIENLGAIPPYQAGKATETLREALDNWQNHSLKHKRFYPSIEHAIKARQKATPMPADILKPMVERGLQQTIKGFHWRTDKRLRLNSMVRINEEQIQEFLADISVPTQLILAEPLTYAMDYPSLQQRIEALKPQRLDKLAGHHHLHMTEAAVVAERILDFLPDH
ncbi:alpha/beta hydrolase [Marinicella gelatinilytica]|uniref:alpha/beta hydrolase n=1 Tax=Marinicella gelatinilytica TaxID=2996017 RepID=UPI002260CD79|nr:alpha/beta hydrolase [Marinicella gelatinilytica]MCX7545324.1 alpha/beta hydrolase [Marinicella gelatinilytica]